MTSRADWEKMLGAAEEAEIQGVEATYPLLGDERPEDVVGTPKRWRLAVVYRDEFSDHELTSLEDGVDRVVRMSSNTKAQGDRLRSFLTAYAAESEGRVEVDLQMLRNIAEIRRLRSAYPELTEWTLVCPGEAGDDPEVLVGETLRQLTGVLAGCDCLEIVQGEGESFNALWGRINVARLMATEGELASAPDALSGSGFFAELEARLGRVLSDSPR